ncbi:MAG: ATP-binding protein [Oscillospiraceae bacterium]
MTVVPLRRDAAPPARFQLVCAMNPVGAAGEGTSGRCTCSDREVAKYVEKISGPAGPTTSTPRSRGGIRIHAAKETPESSPMEYRVDAARLSRPPALPAPASPATPT